MDAEPNNQSAVSRPVLGLTIPQRSHARGLPISISAVSPSDTLQNANCEANMRLAVVRGAVLATSNAETAKLVESLQKGWHDECLRHRQTNRVLCIEMDHRKTVEFELGVSRARHAHSYQSWVETYDELERVKGELFAREAQWPKATESAIEEATQQYRVVNTHLQNELRALKTKERRATAAQGNKPLAIELNMQAAEGRRSSIQKKRSTEVERVEVHSPDDVKEEVEDSHA